MSSRVLCWWNDRHSPSLGGGKQWDGCVGGSSVKLFWLKLRCDCCWLKYKEVVMNGWRADGSDECRRVRVFVIADILILFFTTIVSRHYHLHHFTRVCMQHFLQAALLVKEGTVFGKNWECKCRYSRMRRYERSWHFSSVFMPIVSLRKKQVR